SGIRPKLTGPGEPAADFLLDTPAQHGVPGLVQLFGIESPGLTSCLALADRVAILEMGRIVQIGTPREIVATPADDYVAELVDGARLAGA
ncbi:MAG: hypothetical protein ACK4Z4_16965, partial [Ferrovibrio sp.]